jgi:hypothetical protein
MLVNRPDMTDDSGARSPVRSRPGLDHDPAVNLVNLVDRDLRQVR